ncbi:PREDICTED: uncharacterized protein LOC109473344 [Branchiostoma belcheri]|uniref:Uncharacterized protein LOC109473344 n=1 Tax=Branchiostoma belcheri TaxID=7741 RepID=A0A6P4YWQ3_BRABE|nr:PREDICTED: uncharacterized protein LOC109473344 [Branchiostoma belcheri]
MPESLTPETSLRQADLLMCVPEFRCRVPPKVMWKMRIEGLHDHDYTPSSWLQDLRRRPNNRPCRFLSRLPFSSPETPDDGSSSSGESSCSSGREDTSADDLSGDSDAGGELSDSLGCYRTMEIGPDTNTSLAGHDSKSAQLITESLRSTSEQNKVSGAFQQALSGMVDAAQPVTTPSPMSFLDIPTVYDKPRVRPLTNAILATEFAGSSASSIFAVKKRPSDVTKPSLAAAFPSEKTWSCPVTTLGLHPHLAPHRDGLQTSSASARNKGGFLNVETAASCQYDTRPPSGKATHTTNPAHESLISYSTVESIPAPSGHNHAKYDGCGRQTSIFTQSRKRAASTVESVEKSTECLGHDTTASKRRRIHDWLEETDIRYTRQNDA